MSAPGSCRPRTSRSEASCSASESTRTSGLNLRNVARNRSFSRSVRVRAMLRGSHRGPRRAECGEQSGFLLLRLVQMAPLDVAEAADVLGYARDLHRELSVLAVQVFEQLGDCLLVLADPPPLGPALFGVAEYIQRGAAQALQLREDPERGHHPAAELRFARFSRARIGLIENGRGEVEFQLVAAIEHAFDPSRECRVGIESRNLVFVLVRHELEGVAGDGLGERGAGAELRLSGANSFDQLAVSLGIGAVLVAGEELDPARDQLVEIP